MSAVATGQFDWIGWAIDEAKKFDVEMRTVRFTPDGVELLLARTGSRRGATYGASILDNEALLGSAPALALETLVRHEVRGSARCLYATSELSPDIPIIQIGQRCPTHSKARISLVDREGKTFACSEGRHGTWPCEAAYRIGEDGLWEVESTPTPPQGHTAARDIPSGHA